MFLIARSSKCLFCFLLLFTGLQAVAQQEVFFSVSQKEVKTRGRELVNLTVKVHNRTGKNFQGNLNVKASKSLQFLSKTTVPVLLSEGDSLFIPLKLFVPDRLPAGSDYDVVFYLENEKGQVLEQQCKIRIEEYKSVSLVSMVSSVILKGLGDSIVVPLRLSNEGNISQKVNLVYRFPSAFGGDGFHQSTTLSLPAYSDTTIYIRKYAGRDLLRYDRFSVQVMGLYLNGDLFGQCDIGVQSLKNNRYEQELTESNPYQASYSNSITLSAQNLLSEYASYQLMGGSAVDLPFGRLGYNIDATLFRNQPGRPYLRNTYITFETPVWGVSAGNVTRNFDLNLNGRGATVFVADTAKKSRYEIGYVDNSSDLIGPGHLIYDSGRSAWAAHEHQGKAYLLKNRLIYNKDPFSGTDNTLAENELLWEAGKNFRFSGQMNIGHSSISGHPENWEPGVLGSIGVDGRTGAFSINSTNLISTAYYPGIRKGSAIFTERLNYAAGSYNFWLAFNYLKYQPRYFTGGFSSAGRYQSRRAEFGISKTFRQFSLSILPNHQEEMGNYFLSFDRAVTAKLDAWRVNTQLNYTAGKQSLFFSAETGLASNTLDQQKELQFKLNGNYRYGPFNLMMTLQEGSFFIGEVLNNYVLKGGKYSNRSFGATAQKMFLKNRLHLELGLSYNRNSNTGASWSLMGRTEYQLASGTRFFAALTQSQYNFYEYRYNYNNLQLGLSQSLSKARLGTKYNTLEVFLYKDVNQNGKYDEQDVKASGQLLYVDGVAFMTDRNGAISYRNLKDGRYAVSVPASGKWYSPDQQVVLNHKHQRIEIALKETSILKGKIAYIFNEFSYEVGKEKMGITIQATDELGNVIKTKTNDSGQFLFYLPLGSYTLSVAMGALPEQVECVNNNQVLKLTEMEKDGLVFELGVKSRRIETKKFISPSLGKAPARKEINK
jgi:hypothetical protein